MHPPRSNHHGARQLLGNIPIALGVHGVSAHIAGDDIATILRFTTAQTKLWTTHKGRASAITAEPGGGRATERPSHLLVLGPEGLDDSHATQAMATATWLIRRWRGAGQHQTATPGLAQKEYAEQWDNTAQPSCADRDRSAKAPA